MISTAVFLRSNRGGRAMHAPTRHRLMPPADEGGAPKGRRERPRTYSLFNLTYYFNGNPSVSFADSPL